MVMTIVILIGGMSVKMKSILLYVPNGVLQLQFRETREH